METYDAHGLPPRRIGTKIKSTCRTAGALYGGKRGIRTLEGFRGPTRFPVVRLRPAQPSFQGSRLTAWAIIASCAGVVKRLLQYFFRFFGSRGQNPRRPAFWKGKYPPAPAAAGRGKRKKAPRRTGPERDADGDERSKRGGAAVMPHKAAQFFGGGHPLRKGLGAHGGVELRVGGFHIGQKRQRAERSQKG